MSTRVALKITTACLLVSLGVSGCVLGGSGASLTSKEHRQLVLDLEESATVLESVNWYSAKGARFKYEEMADGDTGLLNIAKENHRLALLHLKAMEARWSGIDWSAADREFGEDLGEYLRAARSFYDDLGEALDYFDQVVLLLGQEGEARQAFYVAPAAGDEGVVGDTYRQTLNDAINEMRALEVPTSLRELHKTEIEWLKARLDHLERSRAVGESSDAEEASRLVDEKAAEWTAFRKVFAELELEVAQESAQARDSKEVERLLGEVQGAIADKR